MAAPLERPQAMTVKAVARLVKEIGQMLDHEADSLALYHAYAQRFHASPGSNVVEFVLRDALAHRGMTLDQLKNS